MDTQPAATAPLGLADAEALFARRRAAGLDRAALAQDRWRRFREAAARRAGVPARSRLEQRLDRILARGRWPGRALQIARSGLWLGKLSQSLGFGGGPTASLARYAGAGPDPRVRPKALFDQAWYLQENPELMGGKWPPLAHYLVLGDPQGRSPHPLFDARDYRARHAVKIAASRQSALQHFMFSGAAEGFDPHPLFDLRYYVGQCDEVADSGENPLIHYLRRGWREGLDPHPLFAGDWYLARNPQARASGSAPILHYLCAGAAQGHDPHPLFDTAWYSARRRDVAGSGHDPLSHFIRVGARQLASPGPHFDTAYYLEQHPELGDSRLNPLIHYVTEGAFTGAWPAADFDEVGYLAEHPEAADTAWSGLEHWLRTEGVRPQSFAGSFGRWVSAEALFEQLRANTRTRDPAAYNLPAYEALATELRSIRPTAVPATPPVIDADLGGLHCIVATDPARADAAARASSAERLLFACAPVQGRLTPLSAALAEPGVGLAAPVVVDLDGAALSAGARVAADGTLVAGEAPRTRRRVAAPSHAAAVRRADYLAAGGFDPGFSSLAGALCDLAFRMRARGLQTVCEPDAMLIATSAEAESVADGQRIAERWGEAIDVLNAIRVIAFHRGDLAQAAMGDAIARALPNYRGHHQPRLPDTASRRGGYREQADLARRYGIAGFCHMFRMGAPPAFLLAADAPDMPFCLCLAEAADAASLVQAVAPYLTDPRAVRVSGAPLVLIGRPLGDAPSRVGRLREAVEAEGLGGLYLVRFTDFGLPAVGDPLTQGFDAGVDFAWAAEAPPIPPPGPLINRRFQGVVRDYRDLARLAVAAGSPDRLPGLVAGFDDTPCGQDAASIFHHASPGAFQAWAEAAFARLRAERVGEAQLAFVHAWNGWAEGAHLEPDVRHGHGWLEALRNAAEAEFLERP